MTCLAVMGREERLQLHVRIALNIGLTPDRIIEVLGHMTLYVGVQLARDAI